MYRLVKELAHNISENFSKLDRDVNARLLGVQYSNKQLELKVNKLCAMVDDLKLSINSMDSRLGNNELSQRMVKKSTDGLQEFN